MEDNELVCICGHKRENHDQGNPPWCCFTPCTCRCFVAADDELVPA